MNHSNLLLRLTTLFLSLLLYANQAQASCFVTGEKKKFNGKVNNIYEYDVRDGDTILVGIENYDRSKKLIKSSDRHGVSYYKYDSQNNETEIMDITIDHDEIFETSICTRSQTYRYDKKGRIIEKISKYNDSITSKEVFKYTKKGKIKKHTYYDANDSICHQLVFQYDKKRFMIKKSDLCSGYTTKWEAKKHGKLTDTLVYDDGPTISRKWIMQYDENSRRISEEVFENKPKEEKWKCTYTYDESGNLAELNYSGENIMITKECYSFDDKQHQTEEKVFGKNGTLIYKTNWKYDERNNLIEKNQYSYWSKDKIYIERIRYEYDEEDNVTKEEVFNDESDSASCTTLYYYEYYDE